VQVLQRHGVRVFIRDDLHAKVYLLGTRVVVASANLSDHSRDALDEAGLYTSERSVVREVKEWFRARLGEPVTPKWLAHCQGIYRPPKMAGEKRARNQNSRSPALRRVWLVGTDYLEGYPDSEAGVFETGLTLANERLLNRRRFEVDHLRWTGADRFQRLVRRGDVIVESIAGKVNSHAKILNVRRTHSDSRAAVYVRIPEDGDQRSELMSITIPK
jgi:hypothetical protein